MWMSRWKASGRICVPPELLRTAGWICIAAGGALIVVFVPLKYWMALIGAGLVAVGIWLRCC